MIEEKLTNRIYEAAKYHLLQKNAVKIKCNGELSYITGIITFLDSVKLKLTCTDTVITFKIKDIDELSY